MRKMSPSKLPSARYQPLTKWGIPLSILIAAIFALMPPGMQNRAGVGIASAAVAAPAPAPETSPDSGLGKSASAEPLVTADLLGLSGRLRAVMGTPDALVQNPLLKPLLAGSVDGGAAGWPKLLTPDGDSFTVVTLVPIAEAGGAGYARYHVGRW